MSWVKLTLGAYAHGIIQLKKNQYGTVGSAGGTDRGCHPWGLELLPRFQEFIDNHLQQARVLPWASQVSNAWNETGFLAWNRKLMQPQLALFALTTPRAWFNSGFYHTRHPVLYPALALYKPYLQQRQLLSINCITDVCQVADVFPIITFNFTFPEGITLWGRYITKPSVLLCFLLCAWFSIFGGLACPCFTFLNTVWYITINSL